MTLKRTHISKSSKLRVGITMGDPAGIGPAIIAKALAQLAGIAEFVVIGDPWMLKHRSLRPRCRARSPNGPKTGCSFSPGTVSALSGKASIEYLDKAMQLLRADEIDCLVTCPISKEAIAKAGHAYTGHTEYFAHQTGARDCVMLLMNDTLKISLVTRHCALQDVPRLITKKSILNTIVITNTYLKRYFKITSPRIIVCGLNPHASDNGLIGKEETRVIIPAVLTARRVSGIDCAGPISADVAISRAYHKEYDAVIAMYHDQALIPLKLTGSASGVNVTLGLPFVRTSPLHGTAFDIARTPAKADPSSLIAAIKTAIQCASNQKNA